MSIPNQHALPERPRRTLVKRVLVASAGVLAIAGLVLALDVRATVKSVPRLFKRNAELKASGFYMGEFEFKMMASLFYLNEGRYAKAYLTLRRINNEMKTTHGLIRIPQDASDEDRMAFLLERQCPTTGAFIDPSYPFCTYYSPTHNAVKALQELARKTGKPLKLKYRLRFLDEIRTPERLRAYLDSVLYFQARWAKRFPVTPYVTVSELAYFDELEEWGVYTFSDEWKDTIRRWFFETQDPATGYWGARIGNAREWHQDTDINSTYHVLHLVVDDRGNSRSERYPLRYADTLARNVLKSLPTPIPDDPMGQHDWRLCQTQGIRTITRRLWAQLSEAERSEARKEMKVLLTTHYRDFFRPADGGFSLYTSAPRADVDGTGLALGVLRDTGSLPGTGDRESLWGKKIGAAPRPACQVVRQWKDAALPAVAEAQSVRIYRDALPSAEAYDDTHLIQILYLSDSPVLDVMDLRQHIGAFLASGNQAFGNWDSVESIRGKPLDLRRVIKPIPVSRKGLDLAELAKGHPDAERFYAIGYDLFQVPVFTMEFIKGAM